MPISSDVTRRSITPAMCLQRLPGGGLGYLFGLQAVFYVLAAMALAAPRRILDGTGRVNVGLGVVMTAQGIGAASSPALRCCCGSD